MTGIYPQFEHEKYEELCALATAGALSPHESEMLLAHLDQCAECSEIFAQYEALATEGMPTLAGTYAPSYEAPEAAMFDQQPALDRLLKAVDQPKRAERKPVPIRPARWTAKPAWRGLIAASLLIGVAFASYRIGERRKNAPALVSTNTVAPTASPLQKVAAEREALDADLAADNQRLAELQRQADNSKRETDKIREEAKAAEDRLDALNATLANSKSQSDSQLAALTQERDAVAARLRDAQASYQTAQYELDTLRGQHKQDLLHVASLEEKVTGLNAVLDETDKHAKTDEQYLASDKDIRDLIGARNLYIADIMDVDETGASRKPFGRVFYTKTKSLVFYAYDLDKQQGIKLASTFQVWGRSGAGDRKPINLGMLYMDSETNKRWTLRVDNPQQLAQLDAIFVTAEPRPVNGTQPDKPSGKPFLYASLHREPNHP